MRRAKLKIYLSIKKKKIMAYTMGNAEDLFIYVELQDINRLCV